MQGTLLNQPLGPPASIRGGLYRTQPNKEGIAQHILCSSYCLLRLQAPLFSCYMVPDGHTVQWHNKEFSHIQVSKGSSHPVDISYRVKAYLFPNTSGQTLLFWLKTRPFGDLSVDIDITVDYPTPHKLW